MTPAETLAQSLAKLQTANRVDGSRNSYRKDMAVEYAKVIAYLQGGEKPSGVTSDMGLGLMLAEDARRALNVAPVPPDPIPPDPVPPSGKLITEASYDATTDVDGVPLWSWGGEQVKADDRLSVVADPLGKLGRKVMRVEVRPGDTDVAGSGSGGERAETFAGGPSNPLAPYMAEGTVIAYSWAFMLDANFQSSSSDWNVPFQHHDSGPYQSPVQAWIHNGNELGVRLMGGNLAAGEGTWQDEQPVSTLSKGIWHRLVFAWLHHHDPTVGRMIAAVDGQKKVDRLAANRYAGSGVYFKMGMYRHTQPYTAILYNGPIKFFSGDSVEAAYATALAG